MSKLVPGNLIRHLITAPLRGLRPCRTASRGFHSTFDVRRSTFSALLLAAALTFSACDTLRYATTGVNLSGTGQTGVVNDDQIVVRTEQALNAALSTFDMFLKLERDYEEPLRQVSPEIQKFAEKVRANGKRWIQSAQAAKNAYKQNRTAQNYANLVTAYKTLQEAITQSQQYLNQAGNQ